MFGISIECVCVMLMQRSRCQSLITAQPFGLSLLLLITSSLWLPQLRPARWTHIESEMTRLHSMDRNEPQNLPATPIDQNDMLFLHCCPQATSQEQSASTGGPSAVSNRRVQTRNHGELPLSGPRAKAFPLSLFCIVLPLFPQGLAQPAMKGFLSCFW